MTADYVWLSTAFHDPRQLRPFTNSLSDWDGRDLPLTNNSTRNMNGEPLPAEAFPAMIFVSPKRGKGPIKSLPDLFYGYGFWTVSERCAEVLRRFDLGQGALYPVEVMQKDRTTPIADHPWFCINFGNTKQAFLEGRSDPKGFYGARIGGRMSPNSDIKDGQCVVSPVALQGPDIWIDTLMDQAMFVSAELGNALRKAKCASGWGLRRTPVAAK